MRLRYLVTGTLLATASFFSAVAPTLAQAPSTPAVPVTIHVLEREDCSYCQAARAFFDTYTAENPQVTLAYYDVVNNPSDAELFQRVAAAADVPKVTPIIVVGEILLQGFASESTTGAIIERLVNTQAEQAPALETLIETEGFVVSSALAPGCDTSGGEEACSIDAAGAAHVSVPLIGEVSTAGFSLTAISALLGFVDGFNPCAMWVLITFLLILSQIGDRRRMWQVAGLFILAEAVMYNLILNVWYSAWDFVALDNIVTPVVGFVALGGAMWFLWRWWKARGQSALVCDVTSDDGSTKLVNRMHDLAQRPLTWAVALGIIGVAFSVNVIEFACSIGIPQAYTKILELNDLSFLARQFQLAVFTVMYMIDDLIVFALAIWGFSRLQAHGARYARYSALIGGIALLLLGLLLIFAPEALVLG